MSGGEAELVVLPTVTDSVAVLTLPEVSVALTASVCVPLARVVVFHDQLQDVVPVAVCHAPPSTANAMEATPTLSEAWPVAVTGPDTVDPGAGAEMVTDGGVVSGGGLLTVTDSLVVEEVCPELALAASVWVPLASAEVFQVQFHDEVPEADCHGPPSTETETELPPDDEPATVTVPETELPPEGDEMLTLKLEAAHDLWQEAAAEGAAFSCTTPIDVTLREASRRGARELSRESMVAPSVPL